MFRDLQKGNTVGVLDKTGGVVKYWVGTVVSVGNLRIDPNQQFVKTPVPRMVVDLVLDREGQEFSYTVPETFEITSSPIVTLACNPAALTNEVRALLKQSEDAIASIDTQKANVDSCKTILAELDPQYGESEAQKKRLSDIEQKYDSLDSKVDKILGLLSSQSSSKSK